ncbi:hypothetical protein D3C73_1586270 [compost metagenome]
MQCAAIVSLFAFGWESEQFLDYRKDVHYYQDFALSAEQVLMFDAYVASHSSE